MSFWNRKRKIIDQEVDSPEDLIQNLPKWSIRKKKPFKFFNKDKEFIQVVLISKITGMKAFWAEWDGIGIIRTKNRAYKVPKENIYGDIFIWDCDKKISINELISVEKQDAEDSFHELQMFNMAYSVGRQAGANDLLNKLGFIQILLILSLLASITVIIFVHIRTKNYEGLMNQILSMLPEKVNTVVVK